MMGVYFTGSWLPRSNSIGGVVEEANPMPEATDEVPSFRDALIGFGFAAGVLLVVGPWVVRSGAGTAQVAGLGDEFVGITLIARVTSLPELVAMISAIRFRAYDRAVGNLFGSNSFNIFALALADLIDIQGSFLEAIEGLRSKSDSPIAHDAVKRA
jgi:cation:H+ antiporter